jgi:quercetin dioxygenase-like cupin family protein
MSGDEHELDCLLHNTSHLFARRIVELEPGDVLDHEEAPWRDAIVFVTAGEIELTCVSGEHHSFRCGDILSFARIALGSVHNAQSTPARVLAIWRRATPDSAPVSFRAPGRHTEKDPDLD